VSLGRSSLVYTDISISVRLPCAARFEYLTFVGCLQCACLLCVRAAALCSVAVTLQVEFPEGYPNDTVPILSIAPDKGLNKKQSDELLSLANGLASDNIGMPSIFVVAEGIKEWLVDNNGT
jgi:RWD domain